jgi:hypothetical protein
MRMVKCLCGLLSDTGTGTEGAMVRAGASDLTARLCFLDVMASDFPRLALSTPLCAKVLQRLECEEHGILRTMMLPDCYPDL